MAQTLTQAVAGASQALVAVAAQAAAAQAVVAQAVAVPVDCTGVHDASGR